MNTRLRLNLPLFWDFGNRVPMPASLLPVSRHWRGLVLRKTPNSPSSRRTYSLVFDWTHDIGAQYAVDLTGGGRRSAIMRRMSAKKCPGMAIRRRASRRHVNSCCGDRPCRRATADNTAPGASVSSGIRARSSSAARAVRLAHRVPTARSRTQIVALWPRISSPCGPKPFGNSPGVAVFGSLRWAPAP